MELTPGKKTPKRKYEDAIQVDPLMEIRSVQKKSMWKSPPSYWAKYPQPNYSAFKTPDFVDQLGREYKKPVKDHRLPESLRESGKISANEVETPLYSELDNGRTLFWIRIPIRLRDNVGFPSVSPFGETIRMLDVDKYVELVGKVEECYYGPGRKTGYVIVSGLKSLGQVDPDKWKSLVSKDNLKKYKKSPFGWKK